MKQYFNVNVKAHYTILDLIEIIFLAYLCMVSDDAIAAESTKMCHIVLMSFFSDILSNILTVCVTAFLYFSAHSVCSH